MSEEQKYKGITYVVVGGVELPKLNVGILPDQKKVSLCVEEGNLITLLAHFGSEEAANRFRQWLEDYTHILTNGHGFTKDG